MRHEEWRPLPEYEGWYEVSSSGRVRSVARELVTSRGDTRSYKGKVLSPGSSGVGNYPQVNCQKNGTTKIVRVHVAVALAFIGERPPGHLVLHRDGNPQNGWAENLYYGTNRQNSADRVSHGRDFCGENHPGAVLVEDEVDQIRARIRSGETHKEIAADFGIVRTTVSAIHSGRSWSGTSTALRQAA